MNRFSKKKIAKPALNQSLHLKIQDDKNSSVDDEYITFSLQFVQKDYCFEDLDKEQKLGVISSFFKRRAMTWGDIKNAPRDKLGTEIISRNALKAGIPSISFITPDTKFIALRCCGKWPMVGFRIEKLFYILWFDKEFKLYDHGW